MKLAHRSIPAVASAWALLAGCAQAPIPPAAAVAEPPERAVMTGSRLPQRVDPVTGKVIPNASVRTYTRADLDQTGRVGLAASLHAAQPSQP
jgi:hypothetical protein